MGEIIIEKDNTKKVIDSLDKALTKALKKIGMVAETHAKSLCPADTGLLRNSITFALGGSAPNTVSYLSDSGASGGMYQGTAPKDSGSEMSVTVGTNVYYAPYVELGHNTVKGTFVNPKPFIRPAVQDHKDEYKKIISQEVKKLG